MQNLQFESQAIQTPNPPGDQQLVSSYSLEDWQKGYESLKVEHDYWIDQIEGEIPADLNGTLWRNGPGLFEINGHRVHHPFDGDGMICAIALQNGRAHFRNRYVRTQAFVEEQQVGKVLYRGVFGSNKPGGWFANAFDLRLKNIANTNVLYWGNKLWALWEAAAPHQLDPVTLETLGLDDLNGILARGGAFSAHPRIDPACAFDRYQPCLVNFSVKPGLSTSITLYELAPEGTVLRQQTHVIPGFAFIHDFAITPNYCIFFQTPTTFNPLPYLLGRRGAAQCLTVRTDRPTQVLLIPRKQPGTVRTLEVDAGFVFHHANAFEQSGKLVVDSICYESLPTLKPGDDFRQVRFNELAPGQLWRCQFDLTTGAVDRQLITSRCCEFPVIHPDRIGRPYRYVYLGAAAQSTGNAPLQGILKLDLKTGAQQFWSTAPRGFSGEPIFVPQSKARSDQLENHQGEMENNEDQGWLLLLSFNAEQARSQLIILNAQTMVETARLTLKHHVPYGLHGHFTPQVFLPTDCGSEGLEV